MGYESKLIVINKTDIFYNELNMRFGEKIATFDLCKVPSVARMSATIQIPTRTSTPMTETHKSRKMLTGNR